MTVTSINLSALVDTTHITIKQKRLDFSHVLSPLMHQYILHWTSNFYVASCPFNTCLLAISARSLDSLPLVPNNVIVAHSFYMPFIPEASYSLLLDEKIYCHNFQVFSKIYQSKHIVIQPWNRFASMSYNFCSLLCILIIYVM